MTDDTEPTLTVQTSGVDITITDAKTAEAALPFVEGVLEHYLGDPDERMTQKRHTAVDAECDKCGYEWEYRGQSPNGSTCPDCNNYTTIDADTEDRR